MPDEYISREKTLALLKSLGSRDYRREKGTIQDAIKMISSAAYTPAADVAPVVRCRDCIYNIDGMCFCRRPLGSGVAVESDDFCRWGEIE